MWQRDSYKLRDVSKKLKKLWCNKIENKSWSHELRYSPHTDINFHFPNHKTKKEIRKWTLVAMLRNAWIQTLAKALIKFWHK